MTPEEVLPHDLDAERSVLGSILADNSALWEVGALLRPEHFYRVAHGKMYAALVGLAERSVPADEVTLVHELRRVGDLVECGGPLEVSLLQNGVPRHTNVAAYAAIVIEKAGLRDLIVIANRIRLAAYTAGDDAAAVLEQAEQALLGITQDVQAGNLAPVSDLLPATMAAIEQIHLTKRPVSGLPTGFADLDAYTRGLHPGNLIVLGGRPGEGKSAMALQIALRAAQTGPVALFSMEMSGDELMTRALAQVAQIDHHQMMTGRLSPEDRAELAQAQAEIAALPLTVDDTAALTPFAIRAKCRRLQAQKGLSLVVVDYLQLLQRPRHAHSREEAVADNTWALKVLAGELRVPVLALSQLNRSSTKEERRPTLSDLRESGAVEQHANVVLLIYRPTNAPAVGGMPSVELLIAKQRNGPQGVTVDLQFRGPSMRFDAPVETWRTA